jgi:hypothetical protein
VKSSAETEWRPARVVNLSVTGVLLDVMPRYRVGDRVEVEIDFMTQPVSTTVVAGIGLVVRAGAENARRAAVQFAVECGLSHRTGPLRGSRFV